jgi:hypothetical protein
LDQGNGIQPATEACIHEFKHATTNIGLVTIKCPDAYSHGLVMSTLKHPSRYRLVSSLFCSPGSTLKVVLKTLNSRLRPHLEGFVVHIRQQGNKAVGTPTSNNTPSPLSFPVETVSSSSPCRQTRASTLE